MNKMVSKFKNIRTNRIILICLLIIAVTFLHYMTRQDKVFLHVIYRQLYFLPIILSGFWFGIRGGLTSSLIITVLYMPFIALKTSGFPGHDLGNFLEIILFNVVGFLVGWLRNREAILQEERRKHQELAAMGKAVACVAHDMKTPLMAIGGFANQIRRKLSDDDKTGKKLDIILQQTARLELLVKDMLAFARPLDLNCQNDNLNDLLEETILIAEEKAKQHKVQLSHQLQKGLLICSYDSHRLQQCLLNLINNAVEASPSGGKVIIRSKEEMQNVVVEVADSGGGISEEHTDEILQPFVSSKKEGTGLGLPIVKKIVEAHGGVLEYEQQADEGMIFRFILPGQLSGRI